ncbi:MAG: flavodoxin family protein, partial [Lachnospiraceae bacterium]|nr:flavodoxin family protein [Lachnospiraceae bacterium]
MKILGVSFGSRNGNNDTICRVALEEAQKLGAEVEFIHLLDWNIEHCTGCCACSVGLVTGKGNICTRKDDFAEFWNNHVLAADGILFVDPIFESGCSGLFKTVMDRVGPGHDMAMNIVGDQISKEAGGKGVDPRFLQQKVTSYIAIGGSDWGTRAEADHAMVSLSPGWRVIDNARFQWCKDILMQEDKLERT